MPRACRVTVESRGLEPERLRGTPRIQKEPRPIEEQIHGDP